MKRSRFTEVQIIDILKRHKTGVSVADLCRKHGVSDATVYMGKAMSVRAQHDLRKDLKAVRYLTEFFADLWPGTAQDLFLETLRHLQDDLGEMTDSALAKSLGHEDAADTVTPHGRAAEAWSHLQRQDPWWRTAESKA